MKTILGSKTNEVIIDTGGPVRIIGECINPTRRKKLVDSLQARQFDYVLELAGNQIDNFADILDVNVGFPGVDDVKLLPDVVIAIQQKFNIPLSLDSTSPKAVEAALRVAGSKCLINSVNGEESSQNAFLPLAREFGAAVIGLTMDNDGIPDDPEKRLAIAGKILEKAVRTGIDEEDIIIDPLAMAVSADPRACLVTLETIRLIRQKLGLNITLGASNISFGLPGRETLNEAFLVLAILNGVTCPIANPEKAVAIVRAAEMVLGKDDWGIRFISYFDRTRDCGGCLAHFDS